MLDAGHNPNAVVYTSLIINFFLKGHKLFQGANPPISPTYMDCVLKAGEIERGR
jgi:hypothetical protein